MLLLPFTNGIALCLLPLLIITFHEQAFNRYIGSHISTTAINHQPARLRLFQISSYETSKVSNIITIATIPIAKNTFIILFLIHKSPTCL